MKNIILKKIIILSLVSFVCLSVGVIYGLVIKDRVFIIMSSLICLVNVYKIWELHMLDKNKKFISVSGTCVGGTYNILGRYRIYKFLCNDEVVELSVPKNVKFVADEEYVLYFKLQNADVFKYDIWIKNKILSESFLGFEKVVEE